MAVLIYCGWCLTTVGQMLSRVAYSPSPRNVFVPPTLLDSHLSALLAANNRTYLPIDVHETDQITRINVLR